MGDVAQILGGSHGMGNSNYENGKVATPPPQPLAPSNNNPPKAIKMGGLSKQVMNLLGGKQDANSAALPPIVPSFPQYPKEGSTEAEQHQQQQKETNVKVGNKWISSSKPARQWTWAPFASSSRTDGAMFRHWVRANVEYTDYPYAKFDIHLDPVSYTEDEYKRYLQSDTWTKSETDKLMEIVRRYELRWPVIHDRWFDYFHAIQDDDTNNENNNHESSSVRKVEDLQYRYYSVAAILAQTRISEEAAKEAQALAAATTAATTATGPTTNTANPSDPTSTATATTTTINPAISENLLLETAAARSIATSQPQHQPLIKNLGTGTTNKFFDIVYEKDRRANLEKLWHRSKEEELEEMELRKELRLVEAQLRKLKKTGGHILATATTTSPAAAAAAGALSTPAATVASSGKVFTTTLSSSSRNPSRSVSPVPTGSTATGGGGGRNNNNYFVEPSVAVLDQSFASTAPTPMPQFPYLQSGRLVPPATGGVAGINKTLLNRMDVVLGELNIPSRPLPTKRVCDLYDSVRKDILTLLTLQKMLLHKEGNLQAKRLKLAKMTGTTGTNNRVVDEEVLLGITSPNAPATATPGTSAATAIGATTATTTGTGATASRGKGSRAGKGKGSASGGGKGKSNSSKSKSEDATKGDGKDSASGSTKKPKTQTKRKRKSENKTPTAGSTQAAKPPVPAGTAAPPIVPTAASSSSSSAAAVKFVPTTEPSSDTKPSGGGGKKRARKS